MLFCASLLNSFILYRCVMKKVLFCLLWMLFTWVSYASVVQEISSLEDSYSVLTSDIYLINYYDDILDWIQVSCPAQSIESSEKYIQQLTRSLEGRYNALSLAIQLNESLNLHNKLMRAQSRLNKIWWEHYCALKYILYSMQSRLRDHHIQIMESTGIIKDFDWFELWWAIHWKEAKIELLDFYINELLPYKQQLWFELNFKTWDEFYTNDSTWQKVWDKSQELMKLTLYKAMVELKNAWLFTDTDIQELNWKFLLNMHLSCNSFHGNYKVTETLDPYNNHIGYRTEEVPLDVNVCWNYFLLNELPYHFYKIVIHEMWHHFYYFHDRLGNSDFENICWQGSVCAQTDFVSIYAQSNPIEDYAEHFMHRFLRIIPYTSGKITEKTKHFESFTQ